MNPTKKKMTTLQEYVEIDHTTHEIHKEQFVREFKVDVEPNYIKLYLQDISYLNQLPKRSDSILFILLQYVNYKHELHINNHIKKSIAKELDCSLSNINNSITNLVKKEVLIRIDRGVYELNTYLFGKGSWKDIFKHRKSLKLEVFYSQDGGREVIVKSEDEE